MPVVLVEMIQIAGLASPLAHGSKRALAQLTYFDEKRWNRFRCSEEDLELALLRKERLRRKTGHLGGQGLGRARRQNGLGLGIAGACGEAWSDGTVSPLQHIGLEAKVAGEDSVIRVARDLERGDGTADAHRHR